MRAGGGGCAVQQGLAAEAATVVKQALVLAKRRGHAQVTPLHVASAMLAPSPGMFRLACQRSHSHPLQCKALELCFNVALNRLPASSPSALVGHHRHHSQYPSISNALLAAFKRAQAHQRRGSAENNNGQQQQPATVLSVKIELEQLVISILDDPSVSRVMREAGFSSTQVKSNVEKAVLMDHRSRTSSPANSPQPFLTLQPSSPQISQNQIKLVSSASEPPKSDDVGIIIDTLLMNRKKRSLVIVGESISTTETTVKELMNRMERGDVPQGLKEVKFITIPPLFSFCNLPIELVKHKMGELTSLVKGLVGKGVVLYLGDLSWISECKLNLQQEMKCLNSVEHMIVELGRLVAGKVGVPGRLWLVGIATFPTYMRCKTGYDSLESVWGLQPVTIPVNTLGLSIVFHRTDDDDQVNLSCCSDCLSRFEVEARNLQAGICEPTLSAQHQLPPWLDDQSRRICNNDQSMAKLRMKWNSYCGSADHLISSSRERTLIPLCSSSPSSSTSCFSFDQLQNPNSQNSPPSIDANHYSQKFNANVLCDALEEKVLPWQKEIIQEIAGTVLDCRSGKMTRRTNNTDENAKEETWLLFLGHDHNQAKREIAKQLARLVFGSYSSLVSISTSRKGSPEDHRNKSGGDEESCKRFIDRFAEVVSDNPHRVVLVEDLEQADYNSRMGIIRAIETGRIGPENGREDVRLLDAIVVLCCNGFNSEKVAGAGEDPAANACVPLDLNMSVDEEDSVENCELGIVENIVDWKVVFGSPGPVEY